MLRMVGIGGGSGLPAILGGLKELSEDGLESGLPADVSISAIVCVSDDGGSSGVLRQAFGIPAVGDLRNCLAALAHADPMLTDLLQYRFSAGDGLARIGLAGHPLGNLIITGLCDLGGGLARATDRLSKLLRVQGRILPATEASVMLCAEFHDGSAARGESQIKAARKRIERVWLEPENGAPAPGVLQAIESADAIVLGPGSLYTSIVPNLLVAGVAEAIRRSPAVKIFVCNLMSQPGETDGFSGADHLRTLENYLGARAVDVFVFNSRPLDWQLARRYLEAGSKPVCTDESEIAGLGSVPVSADLLSQRDWKVRHDPARLARLVISVTRGALRARDIICGDSAA